MILHERGETMIRRKLLAKKLLIWSVMGAALCLAIMTGCAADTAPEEGREPDRATTIQGTSEHDQTSERREYSGEHSGEGDRESGESAMSSPIIALGQSWNGVLGGLAVSMQYDASTQSVHGTVRNTISQRLCHVQAEPHLKSGTKTVGEFGPDRLGHLDPGQEATSSLTVAGEPELAGVSYDGYVVHMETSDCSGPSPIPHSDGEGGEGKGEHGPTGKSGNETGEEEGSGANALAPDETLDTVRSGARLILKYDALSNSFTGTVKNTTNGILERVRVEVHLSNGTELGPTTPTDMAPGELVTINLPATQSSFTEWTAHAEVGNGAEHGSSPEHGSGGEHQGGS